MNWLQAFTLQENVAVVKFQKDLQSNLIYPEVVAMPFKTLDLFRKNS